VALLAWVIIAAQPAVVVYYPPLHPPQFKQGPFAQSIATAMKNPGGGDELLATFTFAFVRPRTFWHGVHSQLHAGLVGGASLKVHRRARSGNPP